MLCCVPSAGGLFGIQHWWQERLTTHCMSPLAVCLQKAAAVLNTPANLAAFHTAQVRLSCCSLRSNSRLQAMVYNIRQIPSPSPVKWSAAVKGRNAIEIYQHAFLCNQSSALRVVAASISSCYIAESITLQAPLT